jgi:hypothetical protein
MRKSVLNGFVAVLLGLLGAQIGQAQGTLQVSNLGQTPTGSATIGSDSWIAQDFGTLVNAPSTYTLNSIQLLMNPALGNPSGFSVSIYSSLNPVDNLGSLSGSNPSAGGIYTYTSSGITLSAGVDYFVVVTAAAPVALGSYDWSASSGLTENGTLYIDDAYFSSSDGSSWMGHGRQNVFQMAIFATAAPEPGTLGLLALGGMLIGLRKLVPSPRSQVPR